MSTTPFFTIALAGYRTEPYLPRALASVTGQTFTDFEVICYVEESPDRSLELCQEQAARDSRFIVVTAPKSGAVSSTRNYAIDHAQGKYLIALDGDDELDVHMLEKLAHKLAETGPVDVLAFAMTTTTENAALPAATGRLTNFKTSDAVGVYTGIEALRRAGRNGGQFRSYTCSNAYRTQFLREHRLYQRVGRVMEDFEWTPRVWFAAEKFAYLDEELYTYFRRGNSLTTEASSRLVFDLAAQVKSLLDFFSASPIPEDLRKIWGNQFLATFYWFLFHPVSSRKISNSDRQKALAALFAQNGKAQFRQLSRYASRPKRLAVPLLSLAAAGMVWPAKLYFRAFYYPLIEFRNTRRRRSQSR